MINRRPIFLLVLFLVFVVAGCGGAPPGNIASDRSAPAAAPVAEGQAGSDGEALAQATTTRKIIRDVTLRLRVEEVGAAVEQIQAIAEASGGYVANTDLYEGDDGQLRGTIVIRVEAGQLDAALDQIRGLSREVLAERSNARDVTEEYVDLQARLDNLQRTEQELQSLLTEVRENTRSAEDVLSVYRELTQIRGEIEQIQGRMNYLDNLSSLATVTIELYPPDAIVQDPSWSPGSVAERSLSTLISGLQLLVSAVIFIVIAVLPLLLIVLLPLVLLVWLIQRWRRRTRVAERPG